MKKTLIFYTIATMLLSPAIAVQKCVALDINNVPSCSATSAGNYRTTWSGTCDFGTKSDHYQIPITGESTCSSARNLTSSGSIATDTVQPNDWLTYSSDSLNDTRQCWCRMLTPAISKWIYISQQTGALNCQKSCSSLCATRLGDTTQFMEALFTNILSGD